MATVPGYDYPGSKAILSRLPVTYDPAAQPQATPETYATKNELDAVVAATPTRSEVQQLAQAFGGWGAAQRVSVDYLALASDGLITVEMPLYSDVTITLPPSAACVRPIFIKRIGAGTGALTVQGAAGELIDGGSLSLPALYDGVLLFPDRVNAWHVAAVV